MATLEFGWLTNPGIEQLRGTQTASPSMFLVVGPSSSWRDSTVAFGQDVSNLFLFITCAYIQFRFRDSSLVMHSFSLRYPVRPICECRVQSWKTVEVA